MYRNVRERREIMSNTTTTSVAQDRSLNPQDSWEYRIVEAAKVMGIEPAKVEEILSTEGFEVTKEGIPEAGITGLDLLNDKEVTKQGDLRRYFCDQAGVALPRFLLAEKILRGQLSKNEEEVKKEEVDPDLLALQTRFGIKVRLEDLGIEELLPYYSPGKPNRIHQALEKRYGKYGKFIAFRPSSIEVAINETIDYVTDLEQGFDVEESIMVDSELVRLYGVGEVPNNIVNEDPLFPGSPLKRDRSTVNRINWKGISQEVRQFMRLLVEEGEINPSHKSERRAIMELVGMSLDELKETYPETYMAYREKKELDDLPKLRLPVGSMSGKVQDPFAVRSNRRF